MTHYIAIGGEHACLPDNCQAYERLEDAIDGLDNIEEAPSETSLVEIKQRTKEYRGNCPEYPRKIIKRREKK